MCYKVDEEVDHSIVHSALGHWTENTGIQFIPCVESETECCGGCGDDYVRIIKGDGCWSFVSFYSG